MTPLRVLILLVLLLLRVGPAQGAPAHDGLDSVPMERLRAAMRSSQPLAQAWFRLKAGDAAGARLEAKALSKLTPKDPDVWHLLGIASAADGKAMAAEQALRRSLRLRADGWVAMHLVSNLLDRGRVGVADRILRRTGETLGDDPHHSRARAWVLLARGELTEARQRLEALERDSDDAALSWQLSALLAEEGDATAALAAIRRAVAAAPEHPVYRRELFERLAAAQDWSGLVDAASERGADAVGGGVAAYYKGMGLLRLGRSNDAIQAFSAVAEHGKPEPTPLAGAAGYLLQLGAYPAAEKAARVALQSAEDDAPLHHLLAMALTRIDREGEALAHYRRAAELWSANGTYRFDLLVSLCALERADELRAALQKARKDFPEDARLVGMEGRCGLSDS